jgi:hypothetical protein
MPDGLERELRALQFEWPPTPDLAIAVAPRLRPRRSPWRVRLAVGLAVLVAGGVAATPAARSAIADLLGLHGASVRREPVPPVPRERPGHLGSGLRLGRPVTLVQARRAVRFRLTLPAGLGRPDAVWLAATRGQPTRVSLIYGRRPGIPVSPHTDVAVLVTEFRATVTPVLGKSLGAGARVTRIAVPGGRAYAITGKPHGFAWLPPGGEPEFEERRLAGATLLVERGDGVLLRAEGQLPLPALRRLAVRLAS